LPSTNTIEAGIPRPAGKILIGIVVIFKLALLLFEQPV